MAVVTAEGGSPLTELTIEERIERLEKSLTEALNAAREHLANCPSATQPVEVQS
jgi:hypothetical protein